MSNLTGVELMCSVREIKAREVNDQSSRALETTLHTRSARKGCERRWSTSSPPAVRGGACCEENQKIQDVVKTRIHEYSQPAETGGTVNDAVKASSRPWSTRHGPQSCIPRLKPCDRRKILTRASCEECDVARRNRKHQGPSQTQNNETVEEKSITKRTENAPRNCTSKTRPERVRYQEGEGGNRREH